MVKSFSIRGNKFVAKRIRKGNKYFTNIRSDALGVSENVAWSNKRGSRTKGSVKRFKKQSEIKYRTRLRYNFFAFQGDSKRGTIVSQVGVKVVNGFASEATMLRLVRMGFVRREILTRGGGIKNLKKFQIEDNSYRYSVADFSVSPKKSVVFPPLRKIIKQLPMQQTAPAITTENA